MSATDTQMGTVLAVLGPEDCDTLPVAAALAADQGAALVAFSCLQTPRDQRALAQAAGLGFADVLERLISERRKQIEARITALAPDCPVTVRVTHGKTFVEIIRQVMAHDIDYVIKTAEPLKGARRAVFASTDQHLLRKCPCPVWLRLPGAAARPRRILAAVDVDDWDAAEPGIQAALNQRVVDTALTLARGAQASVEVLHVWDAEGEGMVWAFAAQSDADLRAQRYVNAVLEARKSALDTLVAGRRAQAARDGVQMAARLVRGSPATAIPAHAREIGADLVVMGTVARTGLDGIIIGNTAEDIVNTIDRSVVAVKPDGFVSPIRPVAPARG